MSSDVAFQAIFNECVSSGMGGDMKFVDKFFAFLKRKTDLLNSPQAVADVTHIMQKHARAPRRKKKAAAKQTEQKAGPVEANVLPPSKVEEVLDDVDGEEIPSEEIKGPKPVGNGGTTDKYVWTQSLNELTVNIAVPVNVRSKQLDVALTPTTLRVGVRGQPPIVDGKLHNRIHVDQSTWTLDSGTVVVEMAKVDRMNWWKTVIQGDPTIDTRAIEPENSKLGDLDPSTRATVEKMMFDQRQKRAGLPTSEEQQKQEAIRKFMEMHPEMDFSNAKIN
jgi:hypothetical protein